MLGLETMEEVVMQAEMLRILKFYRSRMHLAHMLIILLELHPLCSYIGSTLVFVVLHCVSPLVAVAALLAAPQLRFAL